MSAVLLTLDESPNDKPRHIYKKLAKIHNRSEESVERNIRKKAKLQNLPKSAFHKKQVQKPLEKAL
ncbi:MAG: sporulation initiation factor Spo0A C-terminal domain-containing protein [Clostridiales bacterium]|nr:sporulation initiation factor Spo0A C-terminal domain-containing protein [Clostridiales bacterium]